MASTIGRVAKSPEAPLENKSKQSDLQSSTLFSWPLNDSEQSSISSPAKTLFRRKQPSKPQKRLPINSSNNKSKTDLKAETLFKSRTKSAIDFTRTTAFPPEYTTASSVSAPPLEYKGPFSRSDLVRTPGTRSYSTYVPDSQDNSPKTPPDTESDIPEPVPSVLERPLQGPSMDSDDELKLDEEEEDSFLTSEDFNDKSFNINNLKISDASSSADS